VALEEEHRERVEVERTASGALWEMSHRVTNLVGGVSKVSIQGLQQQLQALKESINQGKSSRSSLYLDERLEILRVWKQIGFSVDRHPAAVADVRSSWLYLRNEIGPELRRFGTPIPDDMQDEFSDALDALDALDPSGIAGVGRLEPLLDPRSIGRTLTQRVAGVNAAQKYINAYLALEDLMDRMLAMYRKDGVRRAHQ
jgi:hypothetical protein